MRAGAGAGGSGREKGTGARRARAQAHAGGGGQGGVAACVGSNLPPLRACIHSVTGDATDATSAPSVHACMRGVRDLGGRGRGRQQVGGERRARVKYDHQLLAQGEMRHTPHMCEVMGARRHCRITACACGGRWLRQPCGAGVWGAACPPLHACCDSCRRWSCQWASCACMACGGVRDSDMESAGVSREGGGARARVKCAASAPCTLGEGRGGLYMGMQCFICER